MSLKVFHIVFVMASIVMSVLVGGWGVWDYRRAGNTTHLAIGIGTLILGVVLVRYSMWFVRKIRSIESL